MKRKPSIKRKAPWVRAGLPGYAGYRKGQPKPKAKLRARSIRRGQIMRMYCVLKTRFLREHPSCAVDGWRPSCDVHHVRGRAGTLLIDTRFWLPVSRQGHDWIHRHPVLARIRGLLAERGYWGTAPKDAITARLRGLM